jgi:hypothetical protein
MISSRDSGTISRKGRPSPWAVISARRDPDPHVALAHQPDSVQPVLRQDPAPDHAMADVRQLAMTMNRWRPRPQNTNIMQQRRLVYKVLIRLQMRYLRRDCQRLVAHPAAVVQQRIGQERARPVVLEDDRLGTQGF